MLEGIVFCAALLVGLWFLHRYNRTPGEKNIPSPLASKVPDREPHKATERRPNHSDLVARPAYYGAAPAPQPTMDTTVLIVAAAIATNEPHSSSSPSYDDSSSRSSSSWSGGCGGSSSSSSDSSSSSSDSCSY